MGKQFKDFVTDAKAEVNETDLAKTQAAMEGGEGLIIVDVREDDEFAAGHVPGSIHLGRGVIERDALKILPDLEAHYVLYCGGGSRSVLAAKTLQEMGYTNVESMVGGFRAWKDSGSEIEGG